MMDIECAHIGDIKTLIAIKWICVQSVNQIFEKNNTDADNRIVD